MSEARLFDFSFNRSVKLHADTPRVTADAGALLLCEADHRLGVTDALAAKLRDPRDQRFVRYPMAELLRERIYAIAMGFSRQDDADRLAHDLWFDLAEGIAPLWLALLSRIGCWREGERQTIPKPVFLMPPPSHAFQSFNPRM